MTHAINSNTNLLSIGIARTHTQMRKIPRGEKESGKEWGETESKKNRKKKKKENKRKFKKERKKKEINK